VMILALNVASLTIVKPGTYVLHCFHYITLHYVDAESWTMGKYILVFLRLSDSDHYWCVVTVTTIGV
jgi:hypothetical protein